ncbi:hypothetical protein BBD42_14360 [Paenibacillus sp. BIHB 4019]|uniref:Uncharacterized protein n=1 Tax=Paenibacillus sp. BIHB 4019 TaxID=1870819 RepID=A0A1B2DIN1_9BACL|nr:RHS repeat-associated core domain-containing protein [Paenibacillus sp. BIHB 4019]ANY67525.1 hypothetical protein BBD42_14360 [Paenibacillus sp. BIHB 4019]
MTDPNGLYYMRARYYHTGIKRFLNRDVLRGSIVEGQTFNRFGYVNGDPVSFIDPFGLNKISSCKDGTDKAVKKTDGSGDYYEVVLKYEKNVKYGDNYYDMNLRDFNRKAHYLQRLSDSNSLIKTKSERDPSITREYKKEVIQRIIRMHYKNDKEGARRLIDKVSKSMDPDHRWELQLNGMDNKRNLKLMDWFTNRRMGTNLANQMKNVPYGSRIKIKVERE